MPIKKVFCTGILSAFLFSILAPPYAQAGIWAERRAAARHVRESASPHPRKPRETLLAQLPSALSVIPSRTETLSENFDAASPEITSRIIASQIPAGDILLPLAHSNFKSARFPQGRKPGLTVLCLQDVHMNAEAQTNISKSIQSLIDQGQVDLVALEGAFKEVDVSGFRSFKDQESMRTAADYFLKENKLSGAIHTALTSSKSIPFVGVDDPVLHAGHIQAYKNSAGKSEGLKKNLERNSQDLEQKKSQSFNPALLTFDRQIMAYRKGGISLGDYVKTLLKSQKTLPPQTKRFLKALDMERSMDFKKVEEERGVLVRALVEELSKPQVSRLADMSLAYRMGRVSHSDFYRFLRDLCKKSRIDCGKFPAMDAYIRYVLVSDGIKAEDFLSEISAMEKSGYETLSRNGTEKELISQSRKLFLVGKLLDFSLSPEEWKEYQESGVTDLAASELNSFESFFKHAELRDQAIASNLLKEVKARNAKVVVLVTGGYHTDGITKILTGAESPSPAAVITLAPKITKIEGKSGTEYLSVFTREKTPLEKLFDGDRLFVSEKIASLDKLAPVSLAAIGAAQNNAAADIPADLETKEYRTMTQDPDLGTEVSAESQSGAEKSTVVSIHRQGTPNVQFRVKTHPFNLSAPTVNFRAAAAILAAAILVNHWLSPLLDQAPSILTASLFPFKLPEISLNLGMILAALSAASLFVPPLTTWILSGNGGSGKFTFVPFTLQGSLKTLFFDESRDLYALSQKSDGPEITRLLSATPDALNSRAFRMAESHLLRQERVAAAAMTPNNTQLVALANSQEIWLITGGQYRRIVPDDPEIISGYEIQAMTVQTLNSDDYNVWIAAYSAREERSKVFLYTSLHPREWLVYGRYDAKLRDRKAVSIVYSWNNIYLAVNTKNDLGSELLKSNITSDPDRQRWFEFNPDLKSPSGPLAPNDKIMSMAVYHSLRTLYLATYRGTKGKESSRILSVPLDITMIGGREIVEFPEVMVQKIGLCSELNPQKTSLALAYRLRDDPPDENRLLLLRPFVDGEKIFRLARRARAPGLLDTRQGVSEYLKLIAVRGKARNEGVSMNAEAQDLSDDVDGGSFRALMIGFDDASAEPVKKLLKDRAFTVESAADTYEALRVIVKLILSKRAKYDAILLGPGVTADNKLEFNGGFLTDKRQDVQGTLTLTYKIFGIEDPRLGYDRPNLVEGGIRNMEYQLNALRDRSLDNLLERLLEMLKRPPGKTDPELRRKLEARILKAFPNLGEPSPSLFKTANGGLLRHAYRGIVVNRTERAGWTAQHLYTHESTRRNASVFSAFLSDRTGMHDQVFRTSSKKEMAAEFINNSDSTARYLDLKGVSWHHLRPGRGISEQCLNTRLHEYLRSRALVISAPAKAAPALPGSKSGLLSKIPLSALLFPFFLVILLASAHAEAGAATSLAFVALPAFISKDTMKPRAPIIRSDPSKDLILSNLNRASLNLDVESLVPNIESIRTGSKGLSRSAVKSRVFNAVYDALKSVSVLRFKAELFMAALLRQKMVVGFVIGPDQPAKDLETALSRIRVRGANQTAEIFTPGLTADQETIVRRARQDGMEVLIRISPMDEAGLKNWVSGWEGKYSSFYLVAPRSTLERVASLEGLSEAFLNRIQVLTLEDLINGLLESLRMTNLGDLNLIRRQAELYASQA